MKNKFLFLILGLFPFLINGQDIGDILKKTMEKCQSVKNGYFEMEYRMKYMDGTDTTHSSLKCYFKKLKKDPLFPILFHSQKFYEGKHNTDAIYTGKELVSIWVEDSTATIYSNALWSKYVSSWKHNFDFYDPLISKNSYPIPSKASYRKNKENFAYIGEENVGNYSCYHIQKVYSLNDESDEMLKIRKIITDYWINKEDYLPVQYSILQEIVQMKTDTVQQYEQFSLTSYNLNNLTDDSHFQLSSIPSYYQQKDYQPSIDTTPDVLPVNTIAPDWSLPSLDDETISLSGLKGKFVLIDFFYRSCYPCQLSLPILQKLHEKYKDKGLVVIGINPIDKKDRGIIEFLSKHISYTVVLDDKRKTARKYSIKAYPTIYLIDKEGNVIYSHRGYNANLEEEIERIIGL